MATTTGGLLLAAAPAGVQSGSPPTLGQRASSVESGLRLVAGTRDRGKPWPGHPGRRLVRYAVQPGDTAGGLAVRFHAWTAELLAVNGISSGSMLSAGNPIRIPVVGSAVRRDHQKKATGKSKADRNHPSKNAGSKHRHPWRNAGASRATVRSIVVGKALRHGVPPRLALAVAWQESGWQQRRVSSAHAVGVMQVLPATARWTSGIVGRRLHPYRLRANITAGVVLLKVLRSQTKPPRAVAAYYQGLAGLRNHGMYRETKVYVANVLAVVRQLRRGWDPS